MINNNNIYIKRFIIGRGDDKGLIMLIVDVMRCVDESGSRDHASKGEESEE